MENSTSKRMIGLELIPTPTPSHISVIKPLTPDYVLWYFRLIIYGILCQMMAVMGMITNVINIVVYVRLGVRKDPINISLLSISISDFCSCFTVMFLNLCMTPGFLENENLPFTPHNAHYLISAWPYSVFVKITMVTTAFITIERCLCVTFPLKIKQIFTPKRVGLVVVSIYVFVMGLTAPIYQTAHMKWVFFPNRNQTLYTLVYTEDREHIEPPIIAIVTFTIPFSAYFITIVSTVIFVRKLKKTAKWRSSVTSLSETPKPQGSNPSVPPSAQAASSSSASSSNKNVQVLQPRDAKVTRMVGVVSTLFIICYTPVSIAMVAWVMVPELNLGRAYSNTCFVMFSFIYLLELTNASLNIFVYKVMSTNYRTEFHKLFHRSAKSKSNDC